jgi:spore coat protein A
VTQPIIEPYVDQLPIPPVLRPAKNGHHGRPPLTVTLRPKLVRLHRHLPLTPVWSYDHRCTDHDACACEPAEREWLAENSFLGPTLEAERDTPLLVRYSSDLDPNAGLPFRTVIVTQGNDDPPAQNIPGQAPGGDPQPGADDVRPWNVVHLHGGRTAALADGWPENAMLAGQSQVMEYSNSQPATMLWYHDHAMGITRYNVFSGLAGGYLVRDDVERAANLPSGDAELPLVLMDRNLETAEDGRFTGRMLHKITAGADTDHPGTAEFFGPFTLVNGRIWPKTQVRRRRYRLRVLNASNARAYRLRLVRLGPDGVTPAEPLDDLQARPDVVWQVGSDGGLFHHPVQLPAGGLILGPAERADLVVDFSGFQDGDRIAFVNTAFAPWNGSGVDNPGEVSPDDLLPFPHVMRFDVHGGPVDDVSAVLTASTVLSGAVKQPLTHDDLPHDHDHQLIALVEHPVGMLMLYELQEVGPDRPPTALGQITVQNPDGTQQAYTPVANHFEDAVSVVIPYGQTQVWKILNLTEDTHPFHVHLVESQVLGRATLDDSGFDPETGTALDKPIVIGAPDVVPVDGNEEGLKDVVRANPHEMIQIAATFDGFTGRYMYHCHVIEHEDRDMMRPFLVLPGYAMGGMNMGGMNMGGVHHP